MLMARARDFEPNRTSRLGDSFCDDVEAQSAEHAIGCAVAFASTEVVRAQFHSCSQFRGQTNDRLWSVVSAANGEIPAGRLTESVLNTLVEHVQRRFDVLA